MTRYSHIPKGDLLRMYRDGHMTQAEIAAEVGMSQQSVSYYVNKADKIIQQAPGGGIRWTAKLKEEVLTLIATGQLTEQEAHMIYDLSDEELEQWRRLYNRHGVRGMRTTRLHEYRHHTKPPPDEKGH